MDLPIYQGDIHDNHNKSGAAAAVKYKECLKNHAATIGVIAIDGCGEFMPSGEEGTLEALRCSACGCHRNFHRKETEGEASSCGCSHKLLSPHHMIMPLALQASEPFGMVRKRFRTKFTPGQKEKMLGFAERVGWKMQRLDEGVVQQFCQEVGVKRRVLKVWMHNNKQNLAKKDPLQSDY
nr:zinc finger homeodomain 4 [Lilium lancifolium]